MLPLLLSLTLVMGGVQSPGLDGHGWGRDKLPTRFELVWDLLLQLNAHKCVGPNGIPPRVLKSWPVTVRPLSVINKHLGNLCKLMWKPANVPIFKDTKADLGNYRSISLTLCLVKLWRKLGWKLSRKRLERQHSC